MLETSLNTNFISEKVAKIRFCPEQYTEASTFVTGSYNLKENSIKFWRLLQNEFAEDEHDVPKSTAKISLNSNTTGMEFLDYNNFVVTSSDGTLSFIYINRDRDENNLKVNFQQESLHKISCNGLSIFDEDIVTIGDDGAWHIIGSGTQRLVRSNANADSTSLTSVLFINRKELITGNNMGVLKVFDTLQDSNKPTNTLMVSCEDEKRCNRVTCLCYHPVQQHIIIAGTEEGSLTVFDLRQPNVPASYLSAHTESINEVNFHKTEPSRLFTCSENGELWLWSQNTFPSIGLAGIVDSTEVPWLNGERAKNSINVTSLIEANGMAINSFDSFRNKILAAGDNEAVYLVDHMY